MIILSKNAQSLPLFVWKKKSFSKETTFQNVEKIKFHA